MNTTPRVTEAQKQAAALQCRINDALYALKDRARTLAGTADWPSVGELGSIAQQLEELVAIGTEA